MAYDTWGGHWKTSWALSWTRADPIPPPVNPTPPSEGPVGGGNIWYTPEMLRRYREHQARLRKYEPEDDREDLRAIVERAVKGLPEQKPVLVAEVAKAIQAEAGETYEFRAPLKEIRTLIAEAERVQMDEEEMIIVGLLS